MENQINSAVKVLTNDNYDAKELATILNQIILDYTETWFSAETLGTGTASANPNNMVGQIFALRTIFDTINKAIQ